MPLMSGVQFFAQAKNIFPDAVRILLTGYADTGTVIDAINKGEVSLYFTTPRKDRWFRLSKGFNGRCDCT
jgi:response regulator RpfG family c-di-GMP phosphodiesterase